MNPTAAAAAAMGMWGKKGLHMGAGDSLQPQDLSTNKNKDHNRMDASRQVCFGLEISSWFYGHFKPHFGSKNKTVLLSCNTSHEGGSCLTHS